ncbi:hypothetical protein EsH8_III_000352 [Colletotrichum jinshuiense]
MSALPPGWEWDYDGSRWFYRYKPNGHVQFHFPKEGDEFPDFIDAFSPAPELAPEEKLESQQQLKRRTTTHDGDTKTKMRATGGPMAEFSTSASAFGGPNDDDDNDGFFFQPENFMYLGPGAYTDVSPFVDEDEQEEAPPPKGKGDGGDKNSKPLRDAPGERQGVSPIQSETNTPSVINSVLVHEVAAVVPAPSAEKPPTEPALAINTQDFPASTQTIPTSPGVPMLDSVERPRPEPAVTYQAPSWDPVGIMAEMATEHTAPAHIETHPDPVEMADNAVLAPIETHVDVIGIAELPEWTSPSEHKPSGPSTHELLHQTNMSDKALYGATFGTGSRPQSSSPSSTTQTSPKTKSEAVAAKPTSDHSLPQQGPQQAQSPPPHVNNEPSDVKQNTSKPGENQNKYQAYVPGLVKSVAPEQSSREPDFKRRESSQSLAREVSLMMGPRSKFEHRSMPSVLQPPQVPPKHPIQSDQPLTHQPATPALLSRPQDPSKEPDIGAGVGQPSGPSAQGPLQHIPSVLKPARGLAQGRPQQSLPLQPASSREPSLSQQPSAPSTSARDPSHPGGPNRGREKPVQYSAFQPGIPPQEKPQPSFADRVNAIPQPGKVPLSLTPGPDQQRSLGFQPVVQRIESAPVQPPTNQQKQPFSQSRVSGDGFSPSSGKPPPPEFLQRPRAQSDVRQQQGSNEQSQPPLTASALHGSRFETPQHLRAMQGPAALVPGPRHTGTSPGSGTSPDSASSARPNRSSGPGSAVGLARESPLVENRGAQFSGPSPLMARGLARETSFASSEVSSLGPPSSSQSELVFQTPSPLETDGRRPSSGFFRGVGLGAHSSQSDAGSVGQNRSPLSGQDTIIRPAGSRPASFSGPSPTTGQTENLGPTSFVIGQGPPLVPRKIPIHSTGSSQPIVDHHVPSTAHSPSSNRRHSLPTGQLASSAAQSALERSQMNPKESIVSGLGQQQVPLDPARWETGGNGPVQAAHSIPRPHSAHPPSIHPGRPQGTPPAMNPQPGAQMFYPPQQDRQTAKQPPSDRPQRPTVTPPTQQHFGPMSPQTPMRTAGHLLHRIEEHNEIEHPAESAPVGAVPRHSHDTRRHSQGSSQDFPSASSYPSSAESPSGYNVDKMMNQAARQQQPMAHPNMPQQQPQLMSSAGQPSHQIYSPVAGNPFQPYSPINVAGSPLQNVTHPDGAQMGMQPPAKDKDKGGWLSKFKKSSNKPTAVLHKPPPPQQAFPAAAQPPHIAPTHIAPTHVAPPLQGHAPYNRPANVMMPNGGPEEQADYTAIASHQTLPTSQKIAPLVPSVPTAPVGQVSATSKTQGKSDQSLGAQNVTVQGNPSLIFSGPQANPVLAVQQSQNTGDRPEQRPTSVPPSGLNLLVGPPKDNSVDNMSDAASVSTMDVSEAQAQPVLKPQLVTVERHVEAQPRQQQGPSRGVGYQAPTSQPPPAGRPDYHSRIPVDDELAVAPLFSKPQAKQPVSAASANAPPAVQDKWAKKPAVDYSGDDWGDDPWDYQ